MYLSIPKKIIVPVSYVEKESLDIEEIIFLQQKNSDENLTNEVNRIQKQFINIMKENIYNNYYRNYYRDK
ncbi:hypothetical protein [Clostridium uliginosum]|uniref:Uncharacterized protein n=1 Tax=Clostridium uliginosum TaxID=119641 RepID=A0A1I1L4K7_9CLOT|nr:hypothetical protein [Clostridium uliginosum]SFC67452.1 hypothetical protein SAMN05421842_10751 [Clostridium uliginosum]